MILVVLRAEILFPFCCCPILGTKCLGSLVYLWRVLKEIVYLDFYSGASDLPPCFWDYNSLLILLTVFFLHSFCLFLLKPMTSLHCMVLIWLWVRDLVRMWIIINALWFSDCLKMVFLINLWSDLWAHYPAGSICCSQVDVEHIKEIGSPFPEAFSPQLFPFWLLE